MAFYMIPYNHDNKLSIYVCLNIILTIITQHFYTFITQNSESWLLQVKISTFITWNLDLLSWNISWCKLKTLNCDFELLSRYFELLGEMLSYCCIFSFASRNVEIKSGYFDIKFEILN